MVESAVISNSFDVKPHIEKFGIDTIVHGDDWNHADYLKQICCTEEYLAAKGVRMVYTPYYPGVSTSSLLRSMELTECSSS